MPYDGTAPQDVVQALDDATPFTVSCGLALPVLGG